MTIRREQMAIFDRDAKSRFVRQLASYVRERHGSVLVRFTRKEICVSEISDSVLHEMVEVGVERAITHGLSWMSSQASFVVTMFTVAPNFDDDALICELLGDQTIEPNQRMKAVCEATSGLQWDDIRRKYDPTEWRLSGDAQEAMSHVRE